MQQAMAASGCGCCVTVGLEHGCLGVGTASACGLWYTLRSMVCMLSQHCANGLQSHCMVVVLALMVEAARYPRMRIHMPYGPGLCCTDRPRRVATLEIMMKYGMGYPRLRTKCTLTLLYARQYCRGRTTTSTHRGTDLCVVIGIQ